MLFLIKAFLTLYINGTSNPISNNKSSFKNTLCGLSSKTIFPLDKTITQSESNTSSKS